MTNKIGVTIAMLLAVGAIGLTNLASAAPSPARAVTSAQCPDVCITVYEPVTCLMSDNTLHTFTNRCWAEVYACMHGLQIIGCVPALD
jgi:hypothetical protein